jgi:hypothetical protein
MGQSRFRLAFNGYRHSKLITYYQTKINNKTFNPAFIASNRMAAALA